MYYKEIAGVRVSALGMGNMRLPTLEGRDDNIDREKAREDQVDPGQIRVRDRGRTTRRNRRKHRQPL